MTPVPGGVASSRSTAAAISPRRVDGGPTAASGGRSASPPTASGSASSRRPSEHPAWGRSDRLWLLDPAEAWAPREALTVFQAVDYARPDVIPPLLAPARLPPGAGTAVLNLIAGLMKDRGVARVRYRGPYPTEQLFTALLECFRLDPALHDPLGRFTDGGDARLDARAPRAAPRGARRLRPAPPPDREGRARRCALLSARLAGLIRNEPRVVHEEGSRVICSLWALGRSHRGSAHPRSIWRGPGAARRRARPDSPGSAAAPSGRRRSPSSSPARAPLLSRERCATCCPGSPSNGARCRAIS